MELHKLACSTCRYADKEGYCTKNSYYRPIWQQGCTFHKLDTKENLERINFYYYTGALEHYHSKG